VKIVDVARIGNSRTAIPSLIEIFGMINDFVDCLEHGQPFKATDIQIITPVQCPENLFQIKRKAMGRPFGKLKIFTDLQVQFLCNPSRISQVRTCCRC
jgi:hypothetical protein